MGNTSDLRILMAQAKPKNPGPESLDGMRSLFGESDGGREEDRILDGLFSSGQAGEEEEADSRNPEEMSAAARNEEEIAEVARSGSVDEFRNIIESSVVSPYRTGMLLLHYAACYDLEGVFSKLVESGESPHAKSGGSGTAPIHLVAMRGSARSMEIMIDRFGADPDARDMMQWTPLHCVVARSEFLGQKEDVLGIMETLLDGGADINAVTDSNHNALHLCAKSGDPKWKAMDLLVRRRCDWTALDNSGMTPLEIARHENRTRETRCDWDPPEGQEARIVEGNSRFPDKMARAIRRAKRAAENVPRVIQWIGGVASPQERAA